MLARLSFPLPFDLLVSKTATFLTYSYEAGECEIREVPPAYLERERADSPANISVGGEPAVLANILRIDFRKETFERRIGLPADPPQDLVVNAVNSLLVRLRHVTRAAHVQPQRIPLREWWMEYTADDGSPLTEEKGLYVRHGATPFLKVSFVALTPEIWSHVHELHSDYEPPPLGGALARRCWRTAEDRYRYCVECDRARGFHKRSLGPVGEIPGDVTGPLAVD